VFNEINASLQSDPSRVGNTNARYLFNLTGDDGGEYHITLAGDHGEAGAGAVADPNIVIDMASPDFVDLATGKLDGMMAFTSGKIRIAGDMSLAMKLQSVLR